MSNELDDWLSQMQRRATEIQRNQKAENDRLEKKKAEAKEKTVRRIAKWDSDQAILYGIAQQINARIPEVFTGVGYQQIDVVDSMLGAGNFTISCIDGSSCIIHFSLSQDGFIHPSYTQRPGVNFDHSTPFHVESAVDRQYELAIMPYLAAIQEAVLKQ